MAKQKIDKTDKADKTDNINVKSLSKGIKFDVNDFENFKPLIRSIGKLKKEEALFFEEIKDPKIINKYKMAISLLLSYDPFIFKKVIQEYRMIAKKAKENVKQKKGEKALKFLEENPDLFKDVPEIKEYLEETGIELEKSESKDDNQTNRKSKTAKTEVLE